MRKTKKKRSVSEGKANSNDLEMTDKNNNIDDKIVRGYGELKSIIIKYLPSDGLHNNQLSATLYDIYNNEEWLKHHSEVEEEIFIPAVENAERKLKQNDVSAKISSMINQTPMSDEQLSDREKDVIVALVQGMTNKEIADHLFISIEYGHYASQKHRPKASDSLSSRSYNLCHREQFG